MARSSVQRFFDDGKISARVIERARGLSPDGIGDSTLRDILLADEFGPNDAGHIDAKANRRGDKEARVAGQKLPGNAAPSDARVRRINANEYYQSSWYGEPARRQE
jgi:hypothetical protein